MTTIHALDATLSTAREAVRATGADGMHALYLYFRGDAELAWYAAQHNATQEIDAMVAAFERLDTAMSEPRQMELELEV